MLHMVQVVKWGVAETPQLFVDAEKARTAFVQCAGEHWEERYAAYCDHHGVSSDCFASAQAFVKTIDVSEKSKINLWTFNPEEMGLSSAKSPMHPPAPEEFLQVAKKMVAVKDGLTLLLNDLAKLTDGFARLEAPPAAPQSVDGPERTSLSLSPVRQEKPARDPEEYTTAEWKKFVETIKRSCAGSRNEFNLLPRDDWRQEVYSNRTALEYWDWVADNILNYKEQAQNANYTVIADPDSFGCYRFKNQEGVESEDCCDSEWAAWCAAGLYSEADSRAACG
jgi:hypothetical protein